MALSEEKAEIIKLACSTTLDDADFGSPPIDEVILYADGDNVQVAFDNASADATTSMPIPKETIHRIRVNCNKVYALTTTSTANLYIMGIRLNST